MNRKRIAQRERRIERRKFGLCQDCGQTAVDGSSNCSKHKKLRSVAHKKRNKKRKEDGKCYSCGREFDKLLSENTWACVYCDNRQMMRHLINGR